MVKNPSAKQEQRVQAVGWEDPLEKEMANNNNRFFRRYQLLCYIIYGWLNPEKQNPG